MKCLTVAVLGVCLVLGGQTANAQTQTTTHSASRQRSQSREEREIRQWLDRWAKAFNAHDLNAIKSLYAPDVVAYDLVPPLQYVGRDAYMKDYAEFMGLYAGPIAVEYRDMRITINGTLAVAAGLERISGTLKGGEKSDMWARFTSVFRKVDGRWLDVQDHISVPVDMTTGKGALDLKPADE